MAADDEKLDFTFHEFDPQDSSWYKNRELGQPDDPYNKNCKPIPKDSELYKEYISIGKQLCDQLEEDILTHEDEGWIFMSEASGVTMHKKENEGSSIMTFKGSTVIPCTSEMIRLWIIQMDQRKYWDPTFVEGNYEFEAEPYSRVATYVYSAPWPVTYRDFVVVAAESIKEGGLFLAGAHSIEREDFPANPSYVRGTIYSSGLVIKPLPNDKDGIPQTQVWYTGTVDPAGWIPTSASNYVNSNQPMNLATLRDLIVSVSLMIRDVFIDLFAADESTLNSADGYRDIFDKNIEKHGHTDHPDVLYDACRNYFLKKRVGPSDDELLEAMAKEGKRKTLHRLFNAFKHYFQTVPGGRDLFKTAQSYFEK